MSLMRKLVSLFYSLKLPHTRLPVEFMSDTEEPLDFVGDEFRDPSVSGFKDDRRRNMYGYVPYAPRKIVPDLKGGGIPVHEEYPQSQAKKLYPAIDEANTPRQTRGQKTDTLTAAHDSLTEFDIAVASFGDTPSTGIDSWTGSPNPTTKEPDNSFNARYPYNHVRLTESGHLFEADDTPGSERIKEAHRTGTFYEIAPDGSRVTKIVRDDFTVVVGSERVNIQGGAIVTIDGDCNFYTKGNFTHQVDGDYNLLVKGTKTERVAGEVAHDYHSDYSLFVGRPIDAAVGSGRGNEGGTFKLDIINDFQTTTGGSVIEMYGSPDQYDLDGTTVSHITAVFGDRQNKVVGGYRYDEIASNFTQIVGGSRSFNVVGNQTEKVGGNQVETITGNRIIDIVGNQVETIDGTLTINIAGVDETITGNRITDIVGNQVETIGGTLDIEISGVDEVTLLSVNVHATVGAIQLTGSTIDLN